MTLELGTRLGAYDAGGDSMPIIRGDEVAVDPSTGDLVVLRRGNVGQLVRVPAAGGAETPIDVVGDWRVLGSGGVTLMGHAVASDGRVVIRTLPPASWMFPSGTLDSRRGGRIIPFLDPRDTDILSAGWDRAGVSWPWLTPSDQSSGDSVRRWRDDRNLYL